jgi:hypothetical protein
LAEGIGAGKFQKDVGKQLLVFPWESAGKGTGKNFRQWECRPEGGNDEVFAFFREKYFIEYIILIL